MAEKQVIVAVESTAAMGPYWETILTDYIDKIIRCFGDASNNVEFALVTYNTHGCHSRCFVQRTDWTRDPNVFFMWLSAIPFTGGGFNEAAIAEGLAESLMMFPDSSPHAVGPNPRNVDMHKHCVLVAASNPYPLQTPVYVPRLQNIEQTIDYDQGSRLCDAEAVAKVFPQFSVSLSVLCPRQLPSVKAIYNAGKRNNEAADPPVDVKSSHFLILISESFGEARAALSRSRITMIPTPGTSQQTQSGMAPLVNNVAAQSKHVKIWEGGLTGQRRGQHVFISKLEGYVSADASSMLVANWPPVMKIARLVSEDHMNNKQYAEKADLLVFRAMNPHGFLGQLREKKLCAVIQLPSQTLLISVSDQAFRLIGMLFPGYMVVKKKLSSQQQQQMQQQMQSHSQLQQQQQQQQYPQLL